MLKSYQGHEQVPIPVTREAFVKVQPHILSGAVVLISALCMMWGMYLI